MKNIVESNSKNSNNTVIKPKKQDSNETSRRSCTANSEHKNDILLFDQKKTNISSITEREATRYIKEKMLLETKLRKLQSKFIRIRSVMDWLNQTILI